MKPLLGRINDVAQLLAVSDREVWELLRRGDLTAIRPNGTRIVRIRISEVEQLVERWATLPTDSADVSSTVTEDTDETPKTRRAGSRSQRENRLMSTGPREQDDDTAQPDRLATATP